MRVLPRFRARRSDVASTVAVGRDTHGSGRCLLCRRRLHREGQLRDAGAAFDLLRRASQNRNVKLRDLAAEIVTAVSGKSPEPGAFQSPRSALD